MLLEISGEITPERMKGWSQSKNNTQLWMWLWPPHANSWLIGKDSDAGRDWGHEEKGMTEDETPQLEKSWAEQWRHSAAKRKLKQKEQEGVHSQHTIPWAEPRPRYTPHSVCVQWVNINLSSKWEALNFIFKALSNSLENSNSPGLTIAVQK